MAVLAFYTTLLTAAAGVLVRTLVVVPVSTVGLLLVIALALGIIARRYGTTTLLVCCIAGGLGFFLGILRTDYAWSKTGESPLAAVVGTSVTIEGIVVREPEVRERSLHLYVHTNNDVILVTTDRYQAIAYGDVIRVTGILSVPESFTTDLGRTFNYPGYLLARGVEYRVSFPDELLVTEHKKGNLFQSVLYGIKQSFVTALARVLPEPQLGLGVGLLLGVKQSLGEELEEAFRTTGIIHIVVLSGYNLALVVAFVSLLLSFILPPRPRLVVGLLAIIAFAFMVGLSATVLRASIMAAIALIATTFGRLYFVLRALVLAALLMLMWNPFLLVYDLGFQFSFLATLGLVLVAPQLETMLRQTPLRLGLQQFFITTLAAQVAVTPLLLYHIGEVSLVALVVNVLVLPVVSVAMAGTFLLGLCALFLPSVATFIAYPTYFVLSYIIETARWWSGVPYAALPVPEFSVWWVVVAYCLMGYGVFFVKQGTVTGEVMHEELVSGWTIVSEEEFLKQRAENNPETPQDGVSGLGEQPHLPLLFR